MSQPMNIRSALFKTVAKSAPRVRGFTKHFYFGHPFLDAWFAWFPLNQIEYGGAAVGEIYSAASRIDESKAGISWITEWSAEGGRLKIYAETLLKQNHDISAAHAFLRAYTYYRTAHLATDPDNTNKEMHETYKNLLYCFDQFRELSKIPIEKMKVPLKRDQKNANQAMHGYFLKAKNNHPKEPKPTIIWLSGAESIAEDVYWWCGVEGMERGYNVFAVDNPGDTATRIYNEDMINEGAGDDTLISQMDYLLTRDDVDPKSIFVYGISMGGYRASRFGQIDNRMRAIVANAPMLNASKVLDECRNVYKASKDAQGWGKRMCWQYGVDYRNLKQGLAELVDNVWGKFVVNSEEIKAPFLVMAGENELGKEGIRQAHEFYDRLGSKIKEKRIVTEYECGEAHCQLNNFPLARQIIFDWIEDIMRLTK